MSSRAPAPPADLRPRGRGRRFWQAIVDEFDPSSSELQLLAEACRTLDELDELRAAVSADGATVTGSRGQVRVHPALGEARQARAELRRLLEALNIPAPAGELPSSAGVASLASRRGQRAARARWGAAGA